MKIIYRTFLLVLVLFSVFFFNKKYFSKNNKPTIQANSIKSQLEEQIENKNSLIKNLKYEIVLDKNRQYIISADLSEIININEDEIIKMQKVRGILISNEDKLPILITSDTAEYDNENHNTKFRNNVIITFLNNKITANKIDLNLEGYVAKIYENVKYYGDYGTIKTDNIKINLKNKNIDIYMNNNIQKVILTNN